MPFSAGSSGGDTIEIDVELNTEGVDDQLYEAFVSGLNRVVKTPAFKNGFDQMIKSITKSMEKDFKSSAERMAKNIDDALKKGGKNTGKNAFKNIPKEAADASKKASKSLKDLVPDSLEKSIDRLIRQFNRLDNVIEKLGGGIDYEREAGRNARRLSQIQEEAGRQQTATLNSQLQNQAALANASAKRRTEIYRQLGRQLVIIERAIGKTISVALQQADRLVQALGRGLRGLGRAAVAGTQAAIRALASLGRALGRVGAGGIRKLTTGLRGMARAVGSSLSRTTSLLTSGFRRQESLYGSSYSKRGELSRRGLRRQERDLQQSLTRQERLVRQGQRGILGALTGRSALGRGLGLGAIAAGGAGIAGFIRSGLERYSDEERLLQQFTAVLSGNESSAQALLSTISDFAKTTSFDFVGVADLTRTFLIMGDSAEIATKRTQQLADALAFSGGGATELEGAQRVFAQIASQGRIMGNDFIQLSNALPALNMKQLLADSLTGGDTAELSLLLEAEGGISADAFFTAFFDGVANDPRIDGAAVALAGTLSGMLANLKENFGILGSTVVALIADPLKGGIDALQDFFLTAGKFITGGETVTQSVAGAGAGLGGITETVFVPLVGALGQVRFYLTAVAKAFGGLLALKGVYEIFQLLGLAVRFLLSPLGILITLTAGLGAGFAALRRYSDRFNRSMTVVIDQIAPVVKAFRELGTVLFDKLFGGTGEGAPEFFKNLGDSLLGLNQIVARAIQRFARYIEAITGFIEAGDYAKIFDGPLRQLSNFDDSVGRLIGNIFNIDEADIDAEGGGILGALRNTFLEPIVNFFSVTLRGAVTKAINGLREFFSGLFNDIFGGGDATAAIQGVVGEDGAAITDGIFGVGDSDGIGTRVVDRLENTLLGPIVRFFRGPFSNAVESFGGFIADLYNAIFGGDDRSPTSTLGRDSLGTRIVDLLETTFLGPIVRFFRNPFSNAVETIGGLIGGLYDTLFGEDGGSQSPTSLSSPTGRSIVDRLQDSFLGPIIRFFTGPVASAITSIRGFIGDLYDAIFGGDSQSPTSLLSGDSTGTRIVDVLENTFLGPVVRFLRGPVSTGVTSAISFVKGAIQPALEGISNLFNFSDAPGGGFGGLWDGITESAGMIWAKLQPILLGLVGLVVGFFATYFTADRLADYGLAFLGFIRKAGEVIGGFASNPDVLTAVGLAAAGIAAAAVVIGGAFILGLIEGVASNAPEIGSRLSALINAGIDAAEGLINLPVIDGIAQGIVNSLLVALGIGLAAAAFKSVFAAGIAGALNSQSTRIVDGQTVTFATTFAGGMARQLGSSLKTAFSAQGSGLAGIILRAVQPKPNETTTASAGFASRFQAGLAGAFTRGKAILKTIGSNAAGTIAGGVAGYFAGRQIAESGGGLLEQILGVGGLALGIGAINIPAGIAAGTLGVLGVVMGNSARQAKEAADRVSALTAALQGLSGQDVNIALGNEVREAFIGDPTAAADFGRALVDLGFDFQGYADNVVEGSARADTAFVGILESTRQQALDSGRVTADQFDSTVRRMEETAASGDFTSLGDLINATLDQAADDGVYQDVADNLFRVSGAIFDADANITDLNGAGGDSAAIFNTLQRVYEDFGGSVAFANTQAEGGIGTFESVAEGAQAITDALGDGDTAEQLFVLLNTSGLTSGQQIEAVGAAADTARSQLEDANTALDEFLNRELAPVTRQGVTDDLIRGFTSTQSSFIAAQEIPNITIREGALRDVTADINQQIADAYSNGLESGVIDASAPSTFGTFKEGLRLAILSSGMDDEVEQQYIAALDGITLDEITPLLGDVAAASLNEEQLAKVTALVQAAADAGFVLDSTGGASTRFVASVNGVIEKTKSGILPKLQELANLVTSTIKGGFDKASAGSIKGPTIQTVKGPKDTSATDVATAGQAVAKAAAANVRLVAAAATSQVVAAARSVANAARAIGLAIPPGILAGLGGAANAARIVGASAAGALGGSRGAFFNMGVNLSQAFAQGLRGAVGAAAAAAAALARAASNAAKSNLRIKSPSRVFFDIGTQVGEGFIQGIKDAEGDMAQAIGDALEGAIDAGSKRMALALARAQASTEIFNALIPSTLAGGTPTSSVTLSRAQIAQDVIGFGAGLRSGAGSAFDSTSKIGYTDAINGLKGIAVGLAESLGDTKDEFVAAVEARNALSKFDRDINKNYADLRAGKFSTEEYFKRKDALGSRPSDLTFRQKNLLASGPSSLSGATLGGQANLASLGEALSKIREFGTSSIEAGNSIASTIAQMTNYTNAVRNQAASLGLNRAAVDSVVTSYGLSTTALAAFRNEMTSLNINTTAGAANTSRLVNQLVAIRDYGAELIEAGVNTDTVTAQLRSYRDALVKQAVAFGYNATQVNSLVDQAGLSNTALGNFIKQLQDFDQASRDATATAEAAARAKAEAAAAEQARAGSPGGETVTRPAIETLNVTVPYGDPEAIGLAVLNRVAYSQLGPSV